MKQEIRNIKLRLRALWWFITRDSYYLFSFNRGKDGALESYNIDVPQFLENIKQKHGYATNEEIAEGIAKLLPYLNKTGKNIANNIMDKLNYE